MKYKGYEAIVNFEEDDDIFVGKIANISDKTIISFHADNVAQLKEEFKISVDAYLDACKEWGSTPQKPTSGRLSLRINPSLHSRIVSKARIQGLSINRYIANTLESQV
ncbi:MAG: hypothetical protein Ctma_0917 [Catillopecten margaritatus gill symbiont]|uniref:Antitoxin HicB n=1 Tax=Catillopecten margaritatus gill symbiont TaxID=3083288 RepID=A0AAU6PGT1_9GAMM